MLPRLRHYVTAAVTYRRIGSLLASAPKTGLYAEQQRQRGLVRVEGDEAADFLQGLVTNDIRHLKGNTSAIYCLLLNRQGRILYDSIVYQPSHNTFLLECDAARASQLERHLRMHKVRRRLEVEDVTADLSVWCVFDPAPDKMQLTQLSAEALYMNPKVQNEVTLDLAGDFRDVTIVEDPRVQQLGHRLVVPAATQSLRELLLGVKENTTNHTFRSLRYRLGVGEGPEELPSAKSLPLEANCDYLHGVSFHKGCYVGQELTARTYHTGVIRKRLLPLVFSENASEVSPDASVVDERGRAVGKVRACLGCHGLGLLRVEECLGAEKLTVEGHVVQTFRPYWWPLQAPKSKASL
ncbi:putative transferase CAF17, mitochondrial [Portunus trituberculatus]|uniref:Putative transferase CAF17, mitochondrial n=1 Tax=Portunus trituberculatus TaxID=210409 RepID=A0A5B7CM44_PORTR|nr:putative transferase CAF17, mitochondrial [Portunus trituberculatus]